MSFQQYLRDSEIFYDQCCEAFRDKNFESARRCAIASILISFMAIESFINNMMKDFASLPEGLFTLHERGFLEERCVQFESSGQKAGKFILTNRREYKSLEDKILFLIAKFSSGSKLEKGSGLWQKFERSKQTRDKLSHPRKDSMPTLTEADAKTALEVAKEIIQIVSTKVWKQRVEF
jgi:hypothetical protein